MPNHAPTPTRSRQPPPGDRGTHSMTASTSLPNSPVGSTGQCQALVANPGLEAVGAAYRCWRPLPCPDHPKGAVTSAILVFACVYDSALSMRSRASCLEARNVTVASLCICSVAERLTSDSLVQVGKQIANLATASLIAIATLSLSGWPQSPPCIFVSEMRRDVSSCGQSRIASTSFTASGPDIWSRIRAERIGKWCSRAASEVSTPEKNRPSAAETRSAIAAICRASSVCRLLCAVVRCTTARATKPPITAATNEPITPLHSWAHDSVLIPQSIPELYPEVSHALV